MATDCQRTCDVLWFERTYLEYVKSIFQFYLKTLQRDVLNAYLRDLKEANAAVAEKLTTDGGGLNGLIEDDDDNSCPAIYTGNLGWLPLLILMIYIFFFNLVRFEQCFLSRAFGESTMRQAI